MASLRPRITRALQETVVSHEGIKTVHFDQMGNHHLNAYPQTIVLTDKEGKITGKKVNPAVLMAPGNREKIVKSMTRDEVMAADTVEDLEAKAKSDAAAAEAKAAGEEKK